MKPASAKVMNKHEPHLEITEIIQLVERGRRHRHYRRWIEHIARCAVCRETYKELLATERLLRSAKPHPTRVILARWSLGFATASLALILFWWLFSSSQPPAWQSVLRFELGVAYEGDLRLPEWVGNVLVAYSTPPSITHRSTEEAVAIRLRTPNPANLALDTLTPRFEWSPIEGAKRYRAVLEPIQDPSKAILLLVQGTSATLPEETQLEPRHRYRLRLSAYADANPFSEIASATYEFYTLSQEEQSHRDWARQNAKHAPYTSAIVFYRLGYYQDAYEILAQMPNDATTRQWLEVLRARMQERGASL